MRTLLPISLPASRIVENGEARVWFCMLSQDIIQDSASTDLFLFLRADTTLMHRQLEKNLSLLSPATRDRFVRVLSKFLGFHRVWERAVRSVAPISEVFGPRSRIRYLETDLAALGVSAESMNALPHCLAAEALGGSSEVAMGSMYVMEGSTLGGAVIGRALARESWLPPQGLQYFTPPDRDVRADWRALHDWAQMAWTPDSWPAIAAGARATFAALDAWVGSS